MIKFSTCRALVVLRMVVAVIPHDYGSNMMKFFYLQAAVVLLIVVVAAAVMTVTAAPTVQVPF